MKQLRQISVIGLGLLGASVTLAVQRRSSSVKVVGYSHREATRDKARQLGVARQVVENMAECVENADIVILATPICTFERIFAEIAPHLKAGCIVTDVGSTKVLPHRWAEKKLRKDTFYVGSHPIAGSEKRGVEFARDDLFFGARCILTREKSTNEAAFKVVEDFWNGVGCIVGTMTPAEHDKILGRVSHVPHLLAAALVNASDPEQLHYAGKGFIDTSRVASGPANVWTDILMTNSANAAKGIATVIKELEKLQKAIESEDAAKIENLLDQARSKRADLIGYKVSKKELL